VTPIGLGLAAIGRPAYINLGRDQDLGAERGVATLRARAHALLDRARARGIAYFDVARSYGRAEEFLASWLEARAIAPGEVTIGSKWGYTYTGGWRLDAEQHEVKELTAAVLQRQYAETRALLGGHLALYQIHSATLESGVLDDAAVLAGLAELRAGGLAIGFTTSGEGQAETIERALELGCFDSVQATWNLHERSAGAALARAKEAGLGVMVKEALANGRLSERGGPEPLRRAARERGMPADALALAAALAQPWADVVLSGAVTPAMLDSNLAALAVSFDAELDGALEALREPPERYWRIRSSLRWG
jgi:aryl-alcohol dehydrogenase-like predicted oxidoreductase